MKYFLEISSWLVGWANIRLMEEQTETAVYILFFSLGTEGVIVGAICFKHALIKSLVNFQRVTFSTTPIKPQENWEMKCR